MGEVAALLLGFRGGQGTGHIALKRSPTVRAEVGGIGVSMLAAGTDHPHPPEDLASTPGAACEWPLDSTEALKLQSRLGAGTSRGLRGRGSEIQLVEAGVRG